jgi:hypothetical protein
LQVDVDTDTPNLLRLEKRNDEKDAWQPSGTAFVWKLKPGTNVLRVRSVNHWQRTGPEARVEVEWTPGKR